MAEAAETVAEATAAAVSCIEVVQKRSSRREERLNPKKRKMAKLRVSPGLQLATSQAERCDGPMTNSFRHDLGLVSTFSRFSQEKTKKYRCVRTWKLELEIQLSR